jgi:hypothetical protein
VFRAAELGTDNMQWHHKCDMIKTVHMMIEWTYRIWTSAIESITSYIDKWETEEGVNVSRAAISN